jgi:phosphatidylserine/phosphatidylglycerophosphate/cardiolipin synthase-like enzyme
MSPSKTASSRTRKDSQYAQIAGILVVVLALVGVCGCYFLFGLDPLGLFGPSQGASQPLAPAPQAEISSRRRKTATPTAPQAVIPTPEASTGGWWQVYFTDPNTIGDPSHPAGSVEEKLIQNINQAQKSIHIAAFEFSLTPVAEALIAAKQRGVDVRWVTDDENGLGADSKEGRGQFKMIRKAGIQVKDDRRHGLMHNKFIIFDGQAVWTGSTNITENDVFNNNNNVIFIHSKELADIYESQWSDLWNGQFGSDSPSQVQNQRVVIDGTPIQVLFSPEDNTMHYLVPLVQSAEHQIRFLAFSFTQDDLTKAMLSRAKAGVDVSGIFETRGSETEYSALPPLYCAGLPVRQEGNKHGILHHKVIVIDGSILVTGSLNFSDNANDDNNENTLIIQNAALAQYYLQEFDRRWAEASPPDKVDMKCKR